MARSINFPLAHRGVQGTNYRAQCNARAGEYLRSRRESLGLSQVALGKLLGVAGPVVSSWETGKAPVPPERYVSISEVLRFDRLKFSKVMLRYSNPHLFECMFPGEDPSIPGELADLKARFFLPYGMEEDAHP